MRTRLPPRVHRERNRHGSFVYYYRVLKGPRIRLPDYGTPDFEAAYKAACAGTPVAFKRGIDPVYTGSLRWMVEQYKQSTHFRNELSPRTQRIRDAVFREMVEKSGKAMIDRITEQHIIDGREKRATAGKGHRANTYLKAIKPMFAYARMRGWIEIDPARNVDFVTAKVDGHHTWTIEEVQQFEARHPLGTMANLAMRIMLFTGLRRSDAVHFGRQHVRDGQVHFRPSKTRDSSNVTVTFALLPPLAEAIEATKNNELAFITSEHGKPFKTGASFGNWFRDRCIEARVPGRAHGLRKAGATLAAEAGATANEIMAMWGWTRLAQAEVYTRAADRRVLGGSASAKLMAGFSTQNENANSRTFSGGAGIEEKAQ